MSMLIKYRVHEVAKDFKSNSKNIAQILTEYAATPKNHMQALEENELDLIFEYLTQHNQIADLAEVFAVPDKPKPAETKTALAQPAKGGAQSQPGPE
ncbi:MAG: translation initiation factor IF-2 N-terminal domain-containing protein, partial [Oscillospiraceae bacterium]|nr:translation initiation factor IF-2 N-terminal domain-containing protein [Oscillospiraceae bacterium]